VQSQSGKRFAALAALAVLLSALVVAGCGGGSSTTSGGGSETGSAEGGAGSEGGGGSGEPVNVTAIFDETGIAALAGKPGVEGIELGVEELEAEGKQVNLTVQDTGSNQTQAVNLLSKAASSDADVVLFGSISAEALAMAPIAQGKGVPFVVQQSGTKGVVEQGEYVFRTTTPQELFFPSLMEYLKEQGVKSYSAVVATDSATIAELAESVIPPLAEEDGIEKLGESTVTTEQTNFNSVASQVVEENPDSLFLGVSIAQAAPAISALRRAGYEGLIFASGAFAGGGLVPLGKEANDLIWPEWFTAQTKLPEGKRFVAAYEKKYGETPVTFAGEGWDMTRLIGAAMDELEGEVNRESMDQALIKATEKGFNASQGQPLRFEERDARGSGFILKAENGKFTVVSEPKPGE